MTLINAWQRNAGIHATLAKIATSMRHRIKTTDHTKVKKKKNRYIWIIVIEDVAHDARSRIQDILKLQSRNSSRKSGLAKSIFRP